MNSQLHHAAMQDMQQHLKFARNIIDWTFVAIFSAFLFGLCVLIIMGIIVGRSVLNPITELQEAARKITTKNFSHRVKLGNKEDELGQLGDAFNIMTATLQNLYKELERRSTYDGLTGALNRATFDERLLAECKSADRHKRSLALLMVDIDFFKCVNDTHGHQSGDQVLRTLVELLNKTTRPEDVVARYGGEEFTIILPDTDEVSAMEMSERLRTTIENACIISTSGKGIKITVSIGCAIRQPHTMAAKKLVEASDMALYQAKNTGRNCVVSATSPPPKNYTHQRIALL